MVVSKKHCTFAAEKRELGVCCKYEVHDFIEVFDESDVRYFVSDADLKKTGKEERMVLSQMSPHPDLKKMGKEDCLIPTRKGQKGRCESG